ncbi:MAG: DUF402 domain-containing protein [Anaerolineaceae bacterium]|nr:DUF402 domain-containing protein [Anaerolineaceae bacterium]
MNNAAKILDVIKLNTFHEEAWRYDGLVLEQTDHSILIEARFNRSDFLFHEILLRENDRFVERYYADRWYNIFAIHDKDDDRIKGWYCNVTYPAEITSDRITYVDLALDLLAYPDGHYLILDEDEFAELELDQQTNEKARQALDQLIQLAKNGDLARVTS